MTSHTSIIYISTIKAENIDQVSRLHCKTGAMLDVLWTDLQFTYLYFVFKFYYCYYYYIIIAIILIYCVFLLHNAGYIFSVAKGLLLLLLPLLTYLLTYSMKQSSSWKANRFPASQEIPRILWNPKVH